MQALSELTVLEIGEGVAVAFAGKTFADFGADVIKVESPGGDPVRREGPFPGGRPDLEASAPFLFFNRNKRGVTLDPGSRAGRSLLARPAGRADLILASCSLRDLAGLGIGLAQLAPARPAVVVASLTPFGEDGPHRRFPAPGRGARRGRGAGHSAGAPPRRAAVQAPAHGRRAGRGQAGHGFAGRGGRLAPVRRGPGGRAQRHRRPGHVVRPAGGDADGLPGQRGRDDAAVRRRPGPVPAGRLLPVRRRLGGGRDRAAVGAPDARHLGRPGPERVLRHPPGRGVPARDHRGARAPAEPVAGRPRPARVLRAGGAGPRLAGVPGQSARRRAGGPALRRPRVLPGGRSPGGRPLPPARRAVADGRRRVREPPPGAAAGPGQPGGVRRRARGGPRRAEPGQDAGSHLMSELPLAGIRVIDITMVWSGPSACRMLAALGAEVIRIESIHHFPATSRGQVPYPDPATIAAAVGAAAAYPGKDPGPDPYNRFGPFLATNQGQLSVTMELDTPEGTEAFHRLVGCSDVLVENNARAAGDGLGITWPALRPLNSRLGMVRMAPLGLDGPYANALGYGAHFEALTGIGALRGHPGAAREDAGSTYPMDDVAPQGVVFALPAARMQRERTGAGQLIEFPQGEFLMQGIGDAFVAESMNGESYSPQGNRHPARFQGSYPCRGEEQWIALSIRDDAEW